MRLDNYGRYCLIDGCDHVVYPMNEYDDGLVYYTSNEPPICEDCYESKDRRIRNQIQNIEYHYYNLDPFSEVRDKSNSLFKHLYKNVFDLEWIQ